MDAAIRAYEAGTASGGEGLDQQGSEHAASSLAELLLIVRSAYASQEFAVGLSFLEPLHSAVDRLAGVPTRVTAFHPCPAATMLCAFSELCLLYGEGERAEVYAGYYVTMATLAHGETSAAAGDAHSFLAAVFARRHRLGEALQHAGQALAVRRRCCEGLGYKERPVADAHWNVAVLQHALGEHEAALQSLADARQVLLRVFGENADTATVYLACGQVHGELGHHQEALRCLRLAVRTRQRYLGFAAAETSDAAQVLARWEDACRDDDAAATDDDESHVGSGRGHAEHEEEGEEVSQGELEDSEEEREMRRNFDGLEVLE